ncbi:hypothetical protein COOONC_27584 [Cooperia oncophora]
MYREGWFLPAQRNEVVAFIRVHRSSVTPIVDVLLQKTSTIIEIYGRAVQNSPATRKEFYVYIHPYQNIIRNIVMKIETKQSDHAKFDAYWKEKQGSKLLENTQKLLQNFDMRENELALQDMHTSYSDEFDSLRNNQTSAHTTSAQTQPYHLSRRLGHSYSLRQQLFQHTGTRNSYVSYNLRQHLFQHTAFGEIFSELVHKQPCTAIEKLTILLDKCKGEATRALKYIPRKGSSYRDAIK